MNTDNQDVVIAYCGLVCSKCGAFKKGKCQGCHSEKPMFKNCPIKRCNIDNSFSTCADCSDFQELKECKKLNNFPAPQAQQWSPEIFYVHTKNLHLTLAEFGQVPEGFVPSQETLATIRKYMSTSPIPITLCEPTLGRSGINAEVKQTSASIAKLEELIYNLKNIPRIKIKKPNQLSVSLARYLNTDDNKYWRRELLTPTITELFLIS